MDGAIALLIIVVLIAYIAISVAIANKMQKIAEDKGSNERYWAWCFWLGIVGWVMVLALPDYKAQQSLDELTRRTDTANGIKESNTAAKTNTIDDELPEI